MFLTSKRPEPDDNRDQPGEGDNVTIEPCHGDNDQRAAKEQNKPLADYRQQVIEAAIARLR